MIVLSKAYKCEYCSKLYQMRYYAERHETRCRKNPENNRLCMDCIHLENAVETYYFDTFNGECERTVKVLKCGKKGIYVYPVSVKFSQMGPYEFDDIANEEMKKECDDYAIFDLDVLTELKL